MPLPLPHPHPSEIIRVLGRYYSIFLSYSSFAITKIRQFWGTYLPPPRKIKRENPYLSHRERRVSSLTPFRGPSYSNPPLPGPPKNYNPAGRDQIEQKSPSKMFYNIDNKNVKSDDLWEVVGREGQNEQTAPKVYCNIEMLVKFKIFGDFWPGGWGRVKVNMWL